MHQVLAISNQLKQTTADADAETLTRLFHRMLESFEAENARSLLVSNLLSHERKTRKKASKTAFLRALVQQATAAEREDLYSLLAGLPPSALGDEHAREATRVLVDVLKDVRESMTLQRRHAAADDASISSVVDMAFNSIRDALQGAAVFDESARASTLATFLDTLSTSSRQRIRTCLPHSALGSSRYRCGSVLIRSTAHSCSVTAAVTLSTSASRRGAAHHHSLDAVRLRLDRDTLLIH